MKNKPTLENSLRERIKEKLRRYKFFESLIDNYGFRTTCFALGAVAANLLFAGINAASAVANSSWWYGSMAQYYGLLGVLRLVVLGVQHFINKKSDDFAREKAKLRLYSASGIAIFALEIELALFIAMSVASGKPIPSGKIMAIASAAYAFYKITMAIINFVRAKRYDDVVVRTLRNIGLVDAIVSMFALDVTLTSTFGDSPEMRELSAVLGAAACIITIVIGIMMIINARLLRKRLENPPEI